MKVKGNKRGRFSQLLGVTGATLLVSGMFATVAMATVKGPCANCHTMHNSQNGSVQVEVGAGAGWNASAQLTGGANHAERAQLLKSDCVGCHSATVGNTNTIVDDGNGNKVPIVFNMGGAYPADALAGGNFALNTGAADVYGHNVGGIAGHDTHFPVDTPGSQNPGCGNGCHQSLAFDDVEIAAGDDFNYNAISQGKFNGCKGCHNKVGHHNSADQSYRFLGGHGADGFGPPGVDIVDGGVNQANEDPLWEHPTSTGHNIYKKQTDITVKDSMGTFCAGCHTDFHVTGEANFFGPGDDGGDYNTEGGVGLISANSASNPWLRHPTNVNIPFDPGGEYAAMAGAYDRTIPVAQDPTANTNTIEYGDQVMCLSCHRAHATQYPDALRFNYTKMNAHNAGAADGTGCFFCHTTKGN
jgi:hypothetical protein